MTNLTRPALITAALALYSLAEEGIAAPPLQRGDLVVRSGGLLIRISATDSSQSIITDFPPGMQPWGIDVGPLGDIYVTDCCGGPGHTGKLLRVDAVSGGYSIVAEGGFLENPLDVEVLPDGDLVVADPGALGGQGAILRVRPSSGTQDILASGMRFPSLVGVTAGATNDIYFLDGGGVKGGVDLPNSIFRLDLATLDTALVASGGYLQHGSFLTYANGALYLGDNPTESKGGGVVVRVDPLSGLQAVIASGDSLTSPISVAWRSASCLAISEHDFPSFMAGAIICVDRATGVQSPISIGQYLGGGDMAVFDGGVTPARRTTWGSLKATYR